METVTIITTRKEEGRTEMLLAKLIAEQGRRGLRDRAFAELLGIPRTTWTLTRLGHKPLGARVARAALRVQLFVPECRLFLLGTDTDSNETVRVDTSEPRELVAAS